MDPSASTSSLQKTRLSERAQETLGSQQAQQEEEEHGIGCTSNSDIFAETNSKVYGGASSSSKSRKMMMKRSGSGAGAGAGANPTLSNSHSRTSNAPSRYLVTVLPPSYLPHDPPHPRTSTLCSGYGPPAKFRRGILVPLYPTLSGQLAAIAREYGLPSTGGLAVYLVELNEQGNPHSHSNADNGLSDALVGGPRIGEEAWALLWGQLFAEEAAFSEDDNDAAAASTEGLRMAPGQLQRNDRDAQTPSEPMSDVSSSLGDSSSAIINNNRSADASTTGPNVSHFSSSSGASPYSNSTRFPKSSATSDTTVEQYDTSSPYFRPQSSASRAKMRSHRLGSSSQQPGMLHNKASRASLGTNRSFTQSVASQDISMAYGQAVIVGKLEFDIDRGRGGGKWFDSWLASATADHSGTNSSYPRGGTRHPESQLGSLLRSRMPSSEPASPVYSNARRSAEEGDRFGGLKVNGRGSPSPFISPSLDNRVQRQGTRATKSTSEHSISPENPRASTAMSLTPSQSSVASEQSIDRQSVASSSIGPILMNDKRDSAAFSSVNSQQDPGERALTPSSHSGRSETGTSARHSRTASKASIDSAGRSSTGMVGNAGEQERSASRQSNRSSAGAVSSNSTRGLSDAQFEMLNATPRVRPPHTFRQEQSSPTESHSQTGHRAPSPLPTDAHASPISAPLHTAEEVVDDQEVETELQNAQPTLTEAPSVPPRSRQNSQISARSGASSASFEAVSEDEGEEVDREDAYQALPDEEDAHEPVADHAVHNPEIEPPSSPSDRSQYGESTGQSEHPPSPDMAAALHKDPLKDMFGSDAVTWAELRASQASEPSAAADSALPHAQEALDRSEGPSPAAGLGILSPPAHHAAIPPSASSASFDPFEFDNEGRSPSPPRANDLGGDADVEEITDLLKTFPVAKGPGLSSPINLGDSMPNSSGTTEDTRKSAGPENDFVAAIEERRSAVNHTRTASIASSSYSRRAHSRKSSSISSMRHSRNDSTASSSKKAPLSPIPSPTPAMISLPESDSNFSLASTAQSYPSISEPSSDFAAPIRGGNRAAGLPSDWATQLSAFPGLRSRANTDAATLPPNFSTDQADATVIHAVEAASAGDSETLAEPKFSNSAFLTPNNARDSIGSLKEPDVSRSRSSSIEMMENLDDLEKALQELSPRSQRQPRQAMPMPDLRPLYPFDTSVSASPGYESKSDLEAGAPSTPVVADAALQAGTKPSDEKTPEIPKDQPVILSAPPRGASLPPATPELASAPIEPSPPVPPLPLKIRPRETPLSPDAISVASTTLPYVSQTTPLPTSPIQKVTFGNVQEATPPPPAEDRREVKFAPSPRRGSVEEEQPTSARSVGSRFAGASLKLKNWGNKGKNDAREEAGSPQSAPAPLQSQSNSEPTRSPLGGFKGLSFWRQKESDDAQQNVAVETSLPMSPSTSQPGSNPTPNGGSSGGRIPRKSSLASLKSAMLSRSESASPGPGPAPQIPLPSPANTAYSAFPSPPTHTSLASPTVRPDDYQSFMPSFPPPRPVGETAAPGTPPPLFRGDSSTTTTVESPQSQRAGIGLNSMSDLPAFSSIRARRDLESTPETRDLASGRFFGYEGRGDGHTSSAPVTPAYAEASVVSSSGRLGRPVKANPAKAQFRMSADADLTKMMSHMQAIEFGEDYNPLDSTIPGNKPSTATLAGLGLGMHKP